MISILYMPMIYIAIALILLIQLIDKNRVSVESRDKSLIDIDIFIVAVNEQENQL